MPAPNNDTADLTPVTTFDGPALTFDFPAFQIGVAEYAEGPTGCTVFYFPAGATAAVDIRGGAPGTFMTDDIVFRQAFCFAGGSLYGLEASAGVAAELFAMRGYSTAFQDIALVSGAIVYDFGPRSNAIYPDKQLGRAALRAAREGVFPLGRRGAGISASVGKGFDFIQGEMAGQGGAFRRVGPTKLAVFTVVNATGAIVDREGRLVRGNLDRKTGARTHIVDQVEAKIAARTAPGDAAPGNTTLTMVVTNQRLAPQLLTQLARQVHSSMSRAIQPFHGPSDGDVLFAATTNEIDDPALPEGPLSVLASELAWDAVLASCEQKS